MSPEPFLQSAFQVRGAECGTVFMASCYRVGVFLRIWPETCFEGNTLSGSRVVEKRKHRPHLPLLHQRLAYLPKILAFSDLPNWLYNNNLQQFPA